MFCSAVRVMGALAVKGVALQLLSHDLNDASFVSACLQLDFVKVNFVFPSHTDDGKRSPWHL